MSRFTRSLKRATARIIQAAAPYAKEIVEHVRDGAADAMDADIVLMRTMDALIQVAASRYALDPGAQWKPGEPLRLLLAGYNGTRNTGADVRVEEMIHQLRHIFGDEHIELSITTLNPELTRGYFRTVRQLHMPVVFPRFVIDAVHTQHGVLACEGSMFKSKFANALSTFMVGAIGTALVEQKIAVGYGGEAGAMDPTLADLVGKHCRGALIITRNTESSDIMRRLGVDAELGTDTAWTFEPAPAEVGRRLLREAGWDGETPIMALGPINPFWWPVKPDVTRGAVHALTGAHADAHYKSIYFHNDAPEVAEKQARYLNGYADGARRFMGKHDVFPIVFGMERLDRRACQGLASLLGEDIPLFVSDDYDMYQMVSVLRQARYLVSSRYHALVTTMPGLVPSAGVTMDERIRNLMLDRETPELALEVDDPALGAKVYEVLEVLHDQGERVREGIAASVVDNLRRMGVMGQMLVEKVRTRHPEFPFRPEMGLAGSPWDHLPALPPNVQAMVERYASAAA